MKRQRLGDVAPQDKAIMEFRRVTRRGCGVDNGQDMLDDAGSTGLHDCSSADTRSVLDSLRGVRIAGLCICWACAVGLLYLH